jgi:hypothetical protein
VAAPNIPTVRPNITSRRIADPFPVLAGLSGRVSYEELKPNIVRVLQPAGVNINYISNK